MSTTDGQDGLYEMLARAGERRQIPAGGVIFEEGDEALTMFILVSGSVAFKHGDEVLNTVQAPGLFGEMALIDYAPRSLTVVAHEDAEVVEIPERRFWVLVHETPRFAQLVMRVMAHRLRELSGTS
jgi:CRP/FNR family transcriptional regulator, cyclic AMP receptor protein